MAGALTAGAVTAGAFGAVGTVGTGRFITKTTSSTAIKMTALMTMMSPIGSRRFPFASALLTAGAGAGGSATTGAGDRLMSCVNSLGPAVCAGLAPPSVDSGVAPASLNTGGGRTPGIMPPAAAGGATLCGGGGGGVGANSGEFDIGAGVGTGS